MSLPGALPPGRRERADFPRSGARVSPRFPHETRHVTLAIGGDVAESIAVSGEELTATATRLPRSSRTVGLRFSGAVLRCGKMKTLRYVLTATVALAAFARLRGAVDPEEFKRVASDVFKLREIARVVQPDDARAPKRQRLTLVAQIVETQRASRAWPQPKVIVIDYSIDLAARAKEEKEHEKKMAGKAGRQFMHEPDAPTLDERKEFWAHLAPVAGRLANVNRHAGRVVDFESSHFAGPVFVPVAGQYSWDAPRAAMAAATPAPAAENTAPRDTFTGLLRTGMMQIGGETTGVILETETGTYELDTRAANVTGAKLDAFDGKRVVVTGDYRPRPGVEVKERRIIVVRTLRAAP